VHALILVAVTVTLMLGGAALILMAERRAAAWPQPDDAAVTAVFNVADYPDKGTATVTVVITNPGNTPVLVGLSPRRPGWPGRGPRTTVPYRTNRRRYRADRQAAVGVVPPESASRLLVLLPTGRRYRLAVIVERSDGRLRVISVPVTVDRVAFRSPRPRGEPGAR
jgi:hypothetical protein